MVNGITSTDSISNSGMGIFDMKLIFTFEKFISIFAKFISLFTKLTFIFAKLNFIFAKMTFICVKLYCRWFSVAKTKVVRF